jgi:hypothetical protein
MPGRRAPGRGRWMRACVRHSAGSRRSARQPAGPRSPTRHARKSRATCAPPSRPEAEGCRAFATLDAWHGVCSAPAPKPRRAGPPSTSTTGVEFRSHRGPPAGAYNQPLSLSANRLARPVDRAGAVVPSPGPSLWTGDAYVSPSGPDDGTFPNRLPSIRRTAPPAIPGGAVLCARAADHARGFARGGTRYARRRGMSRADTASPRMDDPRTPNQRLDEVLRRAQEDYERSLATLRRSEAILRLAQEVLAEARAARAQSAAADGPPCRVPARAG